MSGINSIVGLNKVDLDYRPEIKNPTGKNGTVSVKGIDNDACFADYRTGIRTFQLTKDKAAVLKTVFEKTAAQLYPNDRDAGKREQLRKKFMADPGIEFHDDGTATVDTTKFKTPILHYCLLNTVGMHTTAMPDYIDEDLYNHLMALAEPGDKRDNYIAELTANLPEGAKSAAISRLDEAIFYAKTLCRPPHPPPHRRVFPPQHHERHRQARVV